MSKNHPNDNIYSILGKLEALKPTPEETRFALVKEIRESVEAQGSVLEGVSAVEAKLAKAFAESQVNEKAVSQAQQKFMGMVHAAQKGSKAASPEVAKVAKSMGKKDAKDFASTKHKGLPQHVAEGHCSKCDCEPCECPTNEDMSRAAKGYEKYGKKGMQALAKAGRDGASEKELDNIRDQHDQYNESTCNECGMFESECSCDHTNEAEITRKPGVTTHRKTDFPGYPVDDNDDIDDENKGKRGRPRKHAIKAPKVDSMGKALGRGRPAKAKPIGHNAPKMHDPFGRVATGIKPTAPKGRVHSLGEAMDLVKLNLTEGRYLEDASGESLNHILNRFRAEVRNFEQGGDLDRDLYDALYDYYVECGEMPYGVQKARDADPMNWVAERLDVELGNHAYGSDPANAEGAGMEMEAGIPGNIPAEQIPGKEDLRNGKGRSYYEEETDSMEHELNELARLAGVKTEGNAFSGKLAHTAKGSSFEQDGETFTNRSSIADKEVDEASESPKADKDYDQDGKIESEKDEVIGSRRKAAGLDEGMEIPGTEESEFNVSTRMSTNGDKNVTVTATGEHAASLLQMLRIAGLGDGAKAQELQAHPEMGDAEGTEEPAVVADEGNAFSGELAQARANHADTFDIDGHEYEVDESDAPVAEPTTEPANAPKPEYSSMKGSTMGPGEGDAGEKAMNPDRPTKNNGDNAMATPPTRAQKTLVQVAALESKLAAEYESIKKLT
jgi:hypothetical protein